MILLFWEIYQVFLYALKNTVFHLISLCGYFMETHIFDRFPQNSAETVHFHKIFLPGNQVKFRYFAQCIYFESYIRYFEVYLGSFETSIIVFLRKWWNTFARTPSLTGLEITVGHQTLTDNESLLYNGNFLSLGKTIDGELQGK